MKRERESLSDDDESYIENEDTTTDGFDSEIIRRTRYIKQQIENMSEEQLTRFEFFVRSHLSRARVKDIMTRALDSKYIITDEMGIVAGGLAKLFIGEIIEISSDVRKERGLDSCIRTEHIEEAFRRMQCDGKVGRLPDRAYMFSRSFMVNSGITADGTAIIESEVIDELLGKESKKQVNSITDSINSDIPRESLEK